MLGAGRLRQDERVDAGVGIELDHKVGDEIERGERLATVRFNDPARWSAARTLLEQAFVMGAGPVRVSRRMVLETIA